ncbi:double-strand break repair helicase AddA [Cognatishimia sp. MH4019]|uniref:double-strand break repair helicase AddA n=1 Tax=Cognatishimia sp. MH4019 TaxID=2854030 RepID=UPI001CD77802|nr:double-strand break repair helicase AddA [Cognatishimia sp. MH4019]
MIRNEATERQVQAADPQQSTWLSANAGSGKTRVLTDRVARLLLEEVEPQHILCLTYTKAAASEMQNRLFARLGAWAMRPDPDLRQDLTELGVDGPIPDEMLRKARVLFARAIETPGGLKIQTIHSFCAALLRRFPLEAGVSPQFKEMDDRAAKLLRDDILDALAEGPHRAAVDQMAAYLSDDIAKLAAEISKHKDQFLMQPNDSALRKRLGLTEASKLSDLAEETFLPGDDALLAGLFADLPKGGANDLKTAAALSNLVGRPLIAADLPTLEKVFLALSTTQLAKTGKVPTQSCWEKTDPRRDALNDFMARIEDARQTRLALLALDKTKALYGFAVPFVAAYEDAKQQRGWLDFDDLILKARALLTKPDVAQWVLFRLDGGIDHILVDEAQDTSPAQWDVIERLAQEFTAGEGSRAEVRRTIFVVGDKKQSIYSFQGADPSAFDRMRDDFANGLRAVGDGLANLQMAHSFRSSSVILDLVDVTLDEQDYGDTAELKHLAFKADLPGRVDLWPVVEKAEIPQKEHWRDPVDMLGNRDHRVVLAKQIAAQIRQMIDSQTPLPVQDRQSDPVTYRPATEGDFLILVQRRSELFHEIIAACKEKGLEIAGADRLKIGGELAVKDLTAYLRFLATPEDNLSLACLLKSPLFNWSEQALFDLAHRRDESFLWSALRRRTEEFPDTLAQLNALRRDADFLRPYELIERILTRFDGRQKLLGRLGPEAEDGIDALLTQALNYEQSEVPSLTGFITWIEADDIEIKRQLDSAGDRIRVMTVHGAKGLEAPIVILPDTADRNPPRADALMIDNDQIFWRPAKDDMPSGLMALKDARDLALRQERMRLLYVAMTRAEKWLIVAAAGDATKPERSWYKLIEAGMQTRRAMPFDFPFGTGMRLEFGNWPTQTERRESTPAATLPTLPNFFGQPAASVPPRAETLSPSDLGGPKALPSALGDEEDIAKLRGTQIHLLLEHLAGQPVGRWDALAETLLGSRALPDVFDEAKSTLLHPDLAFLFSGNALTEVPISADLPAGRMHGTIDRLMLTSDAILAVDFKSNRGVPDRPEDTPDGVLRQMAAYQHGLAQIYPDKQIGTAIVWTTIPRLMRLPHSLVNAAFNRIGMP